MSKMSEMHMEIQDEISAGELSFEQIAKKFGITLEDVDTLFLDMIQNEMDMYGGDTDDGYALASAGFGTDEDYGYYGDE